MVFRDSHIANARNSCVPPLQPFINLLTENYIEHQDTLWNAHSHNHGALFYQFKVPNELKTCHMPILPDACVNILIACDSGRPVSTISGAYLEMQTVELQPGIEYFGFKPYSVLGLQSGYCRINELINTWTYLADIYPNALELIEKLVAARDFRERCALFKRIAEQHIFNLTYRPEFVDALTAMMSAANGQTPLNTLEAMTGYSERYCRKRFKAACGFSPKQYNNIVRFQHALKNILQRDVENFSTLAVDNGYFDQAHFIRDFKKYAASTPKLFRAQFGVADDAGITYCTPDCKITT